MNKEMVKRREKGSDQSAAADDGFPVAYSFD